MYHYVRDLKNSRYPEIKGLDISLFKKQVEFIKDSFSPVTIEDVIDHYERGTSLPDKPILFTFDDGYIDHFTAAFPILQENGIQGSFFIPGKTFTENVLLDVNKIHFILASADVNEQENLRLITPTINSNTNIYNFFDGYGNLKTNVGNTFTFYGDDAAGLHRSGS